MKLLKFIFEPQELHQGEDVAKFRSRTPELKRGWSH